MARTRRRHSYRKSKRWNPKRSGSYYRAKRHLRSLPAHRRLAVVRSHLGSLNPRGRKRGGSRFTKHRHGKHWDRAVRSSLPHWVNPHGKAHVAYAQWLFKLGFPASDPIIELASVWASGSPASSRQVRLAQMSAERWTGMKDKRMRSAGRSVANKLTAYLKEQEAAEDKHQFRYKPGSLVSGFAYAKNPRRGRKSVTARARRALDMLAHHSKDLESRFKNRRWKRWLSKSSRAMRQEARVNRNLNRRNYNRRGRR